MTCFSHRGRRRPRCSRFAPSPSHPARGVWRRTNTSSEHNRKLRRRTRKDGKRWVHQNYSLRVRPDLHRLGNGKEEASSSTPPSMNDQLRSNGSHQTPRSLSHAAVRLEFAADQESPSTPSTSASPPHTRLRFFSTESNTTIVFVPEGVLLELKK